MHNTNTLHCQLQWFGYWLSYAELQQTYSVFRSILEGGVGQCSIISVANHVPQPIRWHPSHEIVKRAEGERWRGWVLGEQGLGCGRGDPSQGYREGLVSTSVRMAVHSYSNSTSFAILL